ncbi:MAG: cupin domain-containing protein [Methyloligellaceae bacterium]
MTAEGTRELATGNLFEGVPHSGQEELFTQLAGGAGARIERIVSFGQASPREGWYDQQEDEWVVLLRGRARLAFADGRPDLEMGPGDHVLLPALCRHRVAWTSEREPTLWLAVHFAATR